MGPIGYEHFVRQGLPALKALAGLQVGQLKMVAVQVRQFGSRKL
jgi:hypothetical protein